MLVKNNYCHYILVKTYDVTILIKDISSLISAKNNTLPHISKDNIPQYISE